MKRVEKSCDLHPGSDQAQAAWREFERRESRPSGAFEVNFTPLGQRFSRLSIVAHEGAAGLDEIDRTLRRFNTFLDENGLSGVQAAGNPASRGIAPGGAGGTFPGGTGGTPGLGGGKPGPKPGPY